jgi:hypothetical protein
LGDGGDDITEAGPDGRGNFVVLPVEAVGEVYIYVAGDEAAGGDKAVLQGFVVAGEK